jgi:DNA-binding CsgD family transcriptional regulator
LRQLPRSTLCELIESAGTRGSLALLIDRLQLLVPFETACILVYRGRGRPVPLYDTFRSPRHKAGLDNYIRYTYVLNPCYQACLNGLRPGIYRMRDLAAHAHPLPHTAGKDEPVRAAAEEEIGYITRGWPVAREEVLLMAALPDGAMAEIGFLRPYRLGGFNDQHLRAMRQAQPAAAAVLRAFWRAHSERERIPCDRSADQALENFGAGVLSARERHVARLILQGHSSLSIGLHLGISLATVKTHRKNAYAKLNISTQSELLAAFLAQIGSAAAA